MEEKDEKASLYVEEIESDLERFNIPSFKSLEEEKIASEIDDWINSLTLKEESEITESKGKKF